MIWVSRALAGAGGSLPKSPLGQQRGRQSTCSLGHWLWTEGTRAWEAPASRGSSGFRGGRLAGVALIGNPT